MTELYPDVNPEDFAEDYERHVEAMTAEDLHRKSDIAAQLAWRDFAIRRLQAVIDSRPAINAGLPATYIEWSQGIYAMELWRPEGGVQ